MYEFKGIKQTTADEYRQAVVKNEAKGYIWFVRDTNDSGSVVPSTACIYLGTRKYSDLTDDIKGYLDIGGDDVD